MSTVSIDRGGVPWEVVNYLRRRRPLLTAVIVLIAPVHTLATRAAPADLLDADLSLRFVIPWVLIVIGVVARLWGAGNLRKSQEITDRGIYRLVRHPLYLGSLAFFLAYFLTVGDPVFGVLLFGILLCGVYYPTMLSEETYLSSKFPDQFARYDPPPRLIPAIGRLPDALRSDRFEVGVAYRNLGFRSLWFAIALPVFLKALAWVEHVIA